MNITALPVKSVLQIPYFYTFDAEHLQLSSSTSQGEPCIWNLALVGAAPFSHALLYHCLVYLRISQEISIIKYVFILVVYFIPSKLIGFFCPILHLSLFRNSFTHTYFLTKLWQCGCCLSANVKAIFLSTTVENVMVRHT